MGKYYSLILLTLTLFFIIWFSLLFEPKTLGQTTYNSTALVNTTVNITNSAPVVYGLSLQTPINLIAYDNLTVECNATVFDYDNNTQSMNATLHQSTVSPIGATDQNFRYFNSSCTRKTPTDYYTNFSCTFTINYFANNGTWYCNATALDSLEASGSNESNIATINPLIAIKMDSVLDYGQIGANQISNDTVANVTNVGNRNANISVKGFAVTEGDGLAMTCTFGNIPVGNERYNISSNSTFGLMNQLSDVSTMIPQFYVPQRTHESLDSINATYWRLQIPVGAGGVCNGKILFTASDRGA